MPIMTGQIRIIRILLRKGLCPQEHQVFTEMRTPWQVRRIFEVTHSDVESRGRLVGFGV